MYETGYRGDSMGNLWKMSGQCATDPSYIELFDTANHGNPKIVAAAKVVCETCPLQIKERCLIEAMAILYMQNEGHKSIWLQGVWAGMDAREIRNRYRKIPKVALLQMLRPTLEQWPDDFEIPTEVLTA